MTRIKMLAENNPMWKGENVGYVSIHEWVKNRFPKPELCLRCNQRPPYDLTNKSNQYRRDLDDWEWLCRKCHMKSDGRINNLHRNPKLSLKEKTESKRKAYEKYKQSGKQAEYRKIHSEELREYGIKWRKEQTDKKEFEELINKKLIDLKILSD